MKHYGYEFLYGVNNVDVNQPLEQKIPGDCTELIDSIMKLNIISTRPDQLTVNQYLPGQGES